VDILERIKRLVSTDSVFFTRKARIEIDADQLTTDLACEAVMNAPVIVKTLRSKNPQTGNAEKLYVIKGYTAAGGWVYTKGKIDKIEKEVLYVFISSKRSTD